MASLRVLFPLLALGLVACGGGSDGLPDLGADDDQGTDPAGSTPETSGTTPTPGPSGTTTTTAPPPADAGPPPSTISDGLSIAVDKSAASAELRSMVTVTLTLTPKSGTSGTVNLAATGLPTGATVAFAPSASVTLGSSASVVTMSITVPSTTTVGASNVVVAATGGSLDATATVALTVKPVLTVTIPKGVGALPNGNTAYGASPIVLNVANVSSANPVTINFLNADTNSFRVHGDGKNGFFHTPAPGIAPGKMDNPRNVTAKGTYNFYLHDEGAKHTGAIVIQ